VIAGVGVSGGTAEQDVSIVEAAMAGLGGAAAELDDEGVVVR
jgi:uncharacterized protein GlcG (DUF336 family)